MADGREKHRNDYVSRRNLNQTNLLKVRENTRAPEYVVFRLIGKMVVIGLNVLCCLICILMKLKQSKLPLLNWKHCVVRRMKALRWKMLWFVYPAGKSIMLIINWAIPICQVDSILIKTLTCLVIFLFFRKPSIEKHSNNTNTFHGLAVTRKKNLQEEEQRGVSMNEGQRDKLKILFINAYALMSKGRPYTEYEHYVTMDQVNGVDVGSSYLIRKWQWNLALRLHELNFQNLSKTLIKVSFSI